MPRAKGEANKTKHLNTNIPTFSVGSASTYLVSGSLNGNSAEFLADTGPLLLSSKKKNGRAQKVGINWNPRVDRSWWVLTDYR